MTLEEVIKHAEEVADLCEYEASKYDMSDSYERHVAGQEGKCAEEHRQLAEWLKDYKRLLEQEPKTDIKLTNSEWVDLLSKQFDISRTSAKEMLHVMMSVKKEDNFKKQFSGRK